MSPRVRPAVGAAATALAAAALVTACSSSTATSSVSASPSASSSPASSSPATASSQAAATPSASGGSAAAAGSLGALPPTQVLAKAQAALSAAKSVHFTASGTGASGQSAFDLKILANGDVTGSITFSGSQLKIVRIGQVAYLSGHPQFLAQVAPGRADLAGKWVKLPASQPAVTGLLDVASLRSGMGGVLVPRGSVAFGPSKPVDGHATVALVESGAAGGTVYVADGGTPYPLLIESAPGTASTATAHFTEWDQPVAVTAPPAAQVVDLGTGTP